MRLFPAIWKMKINIQNVSHGDQGNDLNSLISCTQLDIDFSDI